jgi:outer membrane protein
MEPRLLTLSQAKGPFILKKIILPLILLLGWTISASAQQRIAVIDLRKVFEQYYKTRAADATLKEKAADFEKEKKALVDQYKTLNDEYKKALGDANNQAISADEREKRKKTAESKSMDVREMQQTITQFDRQALSTLDDLESRARTKVLEQIQVVVNAKAAAGNFTLVLDTSSESRNKTPVVLFSTGQDDLTQAVLDTLNASAPPDYLSAEEKKDVKK